MNQLAFTSVIQLSLIPSVVLLICCLYLVLKGKPEIATGIYLAIGAWGHTLKIGPISQTWILLATMAGATCIFSLKNISLQQPKNGRLIVSWLFLWWGWLLFIVFIIPAIYLVKSLLLWTICPIIAVLIFSKKINTIKSFSFAYVLTTIVGSIVLLHYVNANYPRYVINPFTNSYGMGRFLIRNYHSYSYPVGNSIIMLIALLLLAKKQLSRILYLSALLYCTFILYFASSRQTILGTLVVCCLLFYWLYKQKYRENTQVRRFIKRIGILIVGTAVAYAFFYFYSNASDLIYRSNSLEYSKVIYGVSRLKTWLAAMSIILDTNFLGRIGLQFGNWHNLFLCAWVNESIISLMFLLGFLIFTFRQTRNIWSTKTIDNIAIWRMAFFCIFLSTLIHSQFSGDSFNVPELIWSGIFLWQLKSYQLKFITYENSYTQSKNMQKSFD